jgi:hypothetical protein
MARDNLQHESIDANNALCILKMALCTMIGFGIRLTFRGWILDL